MMIQLLQVDQITFLTFHYIVTKLHIKFIKKMYFIKKMCIKISIFLFKEWNDT